MAHYDGYHNTDPIEMSPPVTLPPRPVRKPKTYVFMVSFSALKRTWVCTCGPQWCEHVWEYWKNRKDVKDLRTQGAPVYNYYLARGLVTVPIQVKAWTDKELGLDTNGHQVRMFFNDDVGLWMDEDTAGIDILNQLITIVENSKYMKFWDDCVFKYRVMYRSQSCSNKYHDSRNSLEISDMIESLAGADDEKKAFSFANAYSDLFEGRCLSCKTRTNHANNIPSL